MIALTCDAMKGDKERAEVDSFAAYITKPINIRSLYDSLNRVIAVAFI